MKNLTVLLVFTFLCCLQIGHGQINSELIIRANQVYYYQGQVYPKEKDLIDIYKTNPEAYKVYKNFITARRVHRTLVVASATALGVYYKYNSPNTAVAFGWLTVVVRGAAVITFFSGIPVYEKRGKARKIFNEGVLPSSKVGAIPPSINIQTTQNGISLVLNF